MQPGPNGRRVRSERWGRGLRWQARWETPSGQKSRGFANKDAALAFLAEQRLGLEQRAPVSSVTVAELAERWRAGQLHYRASTAESVDATLARMILPALGGRLVAELSRQDLQEAVSGWAAGWSASRVRVAWSHLTSMLTLAELDGLIVARPKGVRLPRIEREPLVPLTVEQVRMIEQRMAPRYRSMVVVAAASGLRSGELRGLTWDRVEGGVLVVDRQLVGADGLAPTFGPPKSAAGRRRVPVGAGVVAVLAEHRGRFGSPDLVWRTRMGSPVSRAVAGDVWREAVSGLGLRDRSGWHDLRHFHASLLIAGGLSVRAVADRLGHADASETLATYAHLWPTDHDRAVAIVEQAMGASALPPGTVEGPK